ncbi:hypothetical protein [Streptomyces sp. NPDC001450]
MRSAALLRAHRWEEEASEMSAPAPTRTNHRAVPGTDGNAPYDGRRAEDGRVSSYFLTLHFPGLVPGGRHVTAP